MHSSSLILFVLILATASSVSIFDYDPDMGKLYMQYSDMAYCQEDVLQKMSCELCKEVPHDTKLVHYLQKTTQQNDAVAYAMFVDDSNHRFISSFRGTNTKWQLFIEGTALSDTDYDLHDIDDARVADYFFTRYKDYLREDFQTTLKENVHKYSDYTFVFTGHSLGGAMTTHAALDSVLSEIVPKSKVVLYNYGSPRVGNYAYAEAVEQVVPVRNRVVHWADAVPHLPFCRQNSKGDCTEDQSDDKDHEAFWPAWHLDNQIFYNENQTSYRVCGPEDNDCANQFRGALSWSINDHLDYFNLKSDC